jgi:histone acetyltransferase (RNA polymerase elongator complex component)
MTPLVIPIFITHQGCPHRCIFCDQDTITGQPGTAQSVTPAAVGATIEQWLHRSSPKRDGDVQVAFYGGSFTGIAEPEQRALLGAVKPYLQKGLVQAIRISTRPDYINETAVQLLKEYSVTIVELGIQSMDPDVLAASVRGHSAQQSENALAFLKENGFTVGAQIMCGLPGDSTGRLMSTVKKVVALAPDFVRIYPTLVLAGSGLEKMYRQAGYKPLSLAKAVALVCRMKMLFDRHGIRVVRMGLQPTAELAEKVVAGPFHPSFGELVLARTLFKKSRKVLRESMQTGQKRLSIAAEDASVFRGPGKVSIRRLTDLGLLQDVELVFAADQPRNTVAAC